jgi:hypothetical protein
MDSPSTTSILVLTSTRSTAKDFHLALSSHLKGSSISHTKNGKGASGGGGKLGTTANDAEEVSQCNKVGLFIGEDSKSKDSKSKGLQQQGKEQQNQKGNNNPQSSFGANVDDGKKSVIAVGTIAKVLDLLQKKKLDRSGIDLVVFYEVNHSWNVDNVSVFMFVVVVFLMFL